MLDSSYILLHIYISEIFLKWKITSLTSVSTASLDGLVVYDATVAVVHVSVSNMFYFYLSL